jgi:hypothetical protein
MTASVQAFVISLDEETRSPGLEQSLQQQGIATQRISAISGANLDASSQARLVDQWGAWWHLGSKLSASQIGCALSHQMAYVRGLQSGADWALVFEDDAVVDESLQAWLEPLRKLDSRCPAVVSFISVGRYSVDCADIAIPSADGGGEIYPLKWPPASAVAYAINQSAMIRAVRHRGKMAARADWPVWAADVDFYLTVPFAVGHLGQGTTIGDAPASPSGAVRLARSASKLTGIPMLMAPEPYRGSWRKYWRHSLYPSVDWTLSVAIRKCSAGIRRLRRGTPFGHQ